MSDSPTDQRRGDVRHAKLEVDSEVATEVIALPGSPQPGSATEIRDISFTLALRGYDREQVDAYVERVSRLVAELEISSSPQSAIKDALDRVGEQTTAVLQRAREAAEELTATALAESEHASRRARVEAAELMERAQTESRELLERSEQESDRLLAESAARLDDIQTEIEQARHERLRVLDRLRATAAALTSFADEAEREELPAVVTAGEDVDEQNTELLPSIDASVSDDDATAEIDGGGEASASRRERGAGRPRRPRAPRRESGVSSSQAR